jgi:hypothetical protein
MATDKSEKERNAAIPVSLLISKLGVAWDDQAESVLQSLKAMGDKPARNRTQIHNISDFVTQTLLPGLFEKHNSSQRSLDEAESTVDSANTATTTELVIVENIKRETTGAGDNHSACRANESINLQDKEDHCAILKAFLENTDIPVVGDDPALDHARLSLHELHILADDFFEKDRKCNESTTIYDAKVVECNGVQATYESHFCELRQELLTAARTCNERYQNAKDAYMDLHGELQSKSEGWKLEYIALKKIECYVQVWLSDSNVSTVDTDQTTVCANLKPDNSSMAILPEVANVSDEILVDTTFVEEHPGTEGFPSHAYGNLSSYNHQIAACIEGTLD